MPRHQHRDDATVQLATRIPLHLHKAVRLAALDAEESVQAWVADALAVHLGSVAGTKRDQQTPRSA